MWEGFKELCGQRNWRSDGRQGQSQLWRATDPLACYHRHKEIFTFGSGPGLGAEAQRCTPPSWLSEGPASP